MRGRVRRREFITLFCGAAAWPIRAAARTLPRVGYIVPGAQLATPRIFDAFRQGLRELGYVAVHVRWAEGRVERMSELVAELVGLGVDILVVGSSPGALAAMKATGTIPVVMLAGDPVGLGLVASLARPEGNVTGLSYYNEVISGRRLQ